MAPTHTMFIIMHIVYDVIIRKSKDLHMLSNILVYKVLYWKSHKLKFWRSFLLNCLSAVSSRSLFGEAPKLFVFRPSFLC